MHLECGVSDIENIPLPGMPEVQKLGVEVPVSAEAGIAGLLPVDLGQRLQESLQTALTATPEQRAQWRREAADREARELWERIQQRDEAQAVPLTLNALIAKMGWSPEYAKHLVQPYCGCEQGWDGWEFCQHARDLGLAP